MTNYFTDYIFKHLNCDKDEEIALDEVKDIILAKGENADLL